MRLLFGDRAGAEMGSLGPAKVKSPFQFARRWWKARLRSARVADVPPEIVSVPVPKAEALLRLSCPEESVVPPL